MTGRERIRAAFEHREADRVPAFEQSVASDVAGEILGREAYTGSTLLHYQESCAWLQGDSAHADFVEQMIEDVVAVSRRLGFDMICAPWCFARPAAHPDPWTFVYGDPDGDHDVYRLDPESKAYMHLASVRTTRKEPETPDELEPEVERVEAAAERPVRAEDIQRSLAWRLRTDHGDEFEVPADCGFLSIPLVPVWLMACVERPDLVARYLDAQAKKEVKSIEAAAQLGFRILWAGGDLADNKGPVYGPRVFRELLLPRVRLITQRAHQFGMVHVFRTDGNLWSIADEFFTESGTDAYGEIDHHAGMTLEKLKPRYGGRITFWGNIPCGGVLHHGTVQEVIEFTKRLIDVAAPGGGYLFGSSNIIMPNTPARNVLAAYETVHEYGRY